MNKRWWIHGLLVLVLLVTLLPVSSISTAQAGISEVDTSTPNRVSLDAEKVYVHQATTHNYPSNTRVPTNYRDLSGPSSETHIVSTQPFTSTHRYWQTEPTNPTVWYVDGEQVVLPGPDDEVQVIVQLQGDPLATVMRQTRGSARTLTTVETEMLRTYQSALESTQRQVLSSFVQQGLDVQVHNEYTYLVNALSMSVRQGDWESLANTPGVQRVFPDYWAQITLDDSVPLVGAPQVWTMTDGNNQNVTGQGIRVAILDTGIDYTHPDLGGCSAIGPNCKVIGGYDFINDHTDPRDDNGHGTHVAGIVAASGGITGVAPDVQLLAYKVCTASGGCPHSAIIAALEAAANPDGDPLTPDAVDVVNMSLGGPGDPDDPFSQAVDAAVAEGIVVVVSAGNSGSSFNTIGSPGVARDALTVAASDKSDNIANFSSRGPIPGFYDIVKPDIAAPGVAIIAPVPAEGNLSDPSGYRALSGTSMAAPHVAGAAALLRQLHPTWTPAEIKAALMNTASDLGQSVHLQGAGRLDVAAAAADRIIIEPPSLGLGLVDSTVPNWVVNRAVTVTNYASTVRSFTVAPDGNLPAGANITLAPQSFSLGAGQSQVIQVTLDVDTAQVPNAAQAPYTYEDALQITSGANSWQVPLMFVKSPQVIFVFDESPWILRIHDYQRNLLSIANPPNSLAVLLPEGTYDAIALYNPADTRVVKEGIVVPPEGETVALNKSDAIYQINIHTIGEAGQTVHPARLRQYFGYKDSRLGSYLFSGPYQVLYFSSITSAYLWEWVATRTPNNGPVYAFNGYVDDGFNSYLTFQNAPDDLLHKSYQYQLPPDVDEVAVVQYTGSIGGSGGGVAGAIYFYSDPPLVSPFIRQMYLMPSPYPEFRMRFHYEEVYSYPEPGTSVWDAPILLKTPYLTLDAQGALAGHWGTRTPVMTTTATHIPFGLSPPHWMGKLTNTATQVHLQPALGWSPVPYLNQLHDYSRYSDLVYRFYRNGILFSQGELSDWESSTCVAVDGGYLIGCRSYPLPEPDAYTLVIPSATYYINNTPGIAEATLDFNTSLSDRNPPDLLALMIEENGQPTNIISAMTTNAYVAFKVKDDVGLANVMLEYGINGVWNALALQSTPLANATGYTASLPALPPNTFVSLRITAVDTSGNQLEYEMNPAFWVEGVQVNVHVPALTQAQSSNQVSIPVILGEDVTGLGIDSYQFALEFDPTILTPVGIETDDTRSAGWTVYHNFTTPGVAQVVGYHSVDLSGSGELVYVIFDVIGAPSTTSPLTFAGFVFNEGSPAAVTQDGVVEVLDPPELLISGEILYYYNDAPVPQATVTFAGTDIVVVSTDNSGAYQAEVLPGDYTATPAKTGDINDAISALDASLAAQYAVGLITLTPAQLRACDVSGDGSCSAHDAAHIQRYLVQISTPYPVGEWRFDPATRTYQNLNTDLSGEDYTAYLLGDISANWSSSLLPQDTGSQTLSITLPPAQTQAGDTVIVYLEATNAIGTDLVGYTGRVHYDPAVLTPLPAPLVTEDTLSDGWTLLNNAAEPGLLRFTGYDLLAARDAGQLIGFAFRAQPTAAGCTSLNITLRLNEGAWHTLESEVQIHQAGHSLYLPLVIRARP